MSNKSVDCSWVPEWSTTVYFLFSIFSIFPKFLFLFVIIIFFSSCCTFPTNWVNSETIPASGFPNRILDPRLVIMCSFWIAISKLFLFQTVSKSTDRQPGHLNGKRRRLFFSLFVYFFTDVWICSFMGIMVIYKLRAAGCVRSTIWQTSKKRIHILQKSAFGTEMGRKRNTRWNKAEHCALFSLDKAVCCISLQAWVT